MPAVSKDQQRAAKCSGCNKLSKTAKGWCSIECYRKNQRLVPNKGRKTVDARVELSCAICKRTKQMIKSVFQKRKYCSTACQAEARRKKQKSQCVFCKGVIERTPSQIKMNIKKFCTRECYLLHHKSGNHKYGRRTKWATLTCNQCQTNFEVPPNQASRGRFCSRRCHGIFRVVTSKKKDTSIELKLQSVVKNIGLVYATHRPISNITIPDVFIEPNIALYADGDYWHSIPKVKERDVKINRFLEENGYLYLRFSETTINTNLKYVRKRIVEAINET